MIEKYSCRCNLYIYLEGEQDSGIPDLAERITFPMGMGLPVATLISQPLFYRYRSVSGRVVLIRTLGTHLCRARALGCLIALPTAKEASARWVWEYSTGTSKGVPSGICHTLAIPDNCFRWCWAHIPFCCSSYGHSIHLVSICLLLSLCPLVLCLLFLPADDLLVWWVPLKAGHLCVLWDDVSATAYARVFLCRVRRPS